MYRFLLKLIYQDACLGTYATDCTRFVTAPGHRAPSLFACSEMLHQEILDFSLSLSPPPSPPALSRDGGSVWFATAGKTSIYAVTNASGLITQHPESLRCLLLCCLTDGQAKLIVKTELGGGSGESWLKGHNSLESFFPFSLLIAIKFNPRCHDPNEQATSPGHNDQWLKAPLGFLQYPFCEVDLEETTSGKRDRRVWWLEQRLLTLWSRGCCYLQLPSSLTIVQCWLRLKGVEGGGHSFTIGF